MAVSAGQAPDGYCYFHHRLRSAVSSEHDDQEEGERRNDGVGGRRSVECKAEDGSPVGDVLGDERADLIVIRCEISRSLRNHSEANTDGCCLAYWRQSRVMIVK